ncbi:MAG TPA: hypothetical protein VNJ08_07930 [Bacteriovoracaceae bacterium]|nr:hypothetical protein [Bacteriovoracaceae bacterium]
MNSDINNTPRKSSRELKNEVMNDLKKLNRDVDQLKDHLTPGQIIDDAIYYRQERTPRATFDYLKQNPVGTSFLALGTMLLMEDERHRSMEAIAREKASGVMDSARSTVDGVRERVEGVKAKVGDMSASIKSKLPGNKVDSSENYVTGVYDSGSEYGFADDAQSSRFEGSMDAAKSKLSSAKESVQAKIPDIKNKASQGLDAAKSKISSATESVKGQFQEGINSARNMEPLTYVVLGAGLGTLTGASLPLMEREKSFVDNNLEDKISDFTTELQAALNESANILKSEFFNDISGYDFNIFGGKGSESRQSI